VKAFIILGLIYSSIQVSFAEGPQSLIGLFKIDSSKVSGELNKANIFGLSLNLDFKHKLNQYIGINAHGGISLETGQSSEYVSGRSFKPKNSLNLKHGTIELTPLQFLKLELGALNQGYHNNPLFLTNTPFLGAREVLSFSYKQWTFEFDMIQAIPSNYSLSQRLGSIDEGSSRFFNEKLRAIGNGDALSLEFSLGLFAFDQLNSTIAYNSRLLGNSVSGVGPINNKFTQSYKGQNTDLVLTYKNFKYLNLSAEAAAHINQNAAKGKSTGYIVGPVLTSKTFENQFKLKLKTFKNEADATVSFYSSKFTGQTNRKGVSAGLSVDNKKLELEYGLDTYFTKPIISNPFQESETILNLSLRKSYDFL